MSVLSQSKENAVLTVVCESNMFFFFEELQLPGITVVSSRYGFLPISKLSKSAKTSLMNSTSFICQNYFTTEW